MPIKIKHTDNIKRFFYDTVEQLELSSISQNGTTIWEIDLAVNAINMRFHNLTLGIYSNGLKMCIHTPPRHKAQSVCDIS